MEKRLIVSIDGGGIRGIIPLLLLHEIQRQLPFDFRSLEPQWWGTSAGALVSGSLAVQKGVSFEEALARVADLFAFRSAAILPPKSDNDPTRAFDQFLSHNFAGIALHDFPELNIVAALEEDNTPVVFNAASELNLDVAIKASCAFPGIFPPVIINEVAYVDGYVKAKNPIQLALDWNSNVEVDLMVISLGTGLLREHDAVEERVKLADEWLEHQKEEGKLAYFRFNPVLDKAADNMQNTSGKNIMHLKEDTLAYIKNNQHLFVALVDCLKNFLGK